MREHRVRALLMGGQACVFYGAAEFSRDTAFAILASPGNLARLQAALADLQAELIAVPAFEIAWLCESRTPERFIQLVLKFPVETRSLADQRPLLREAATATHEALAEALDAEVRAEMAKDRTYWEPLKRELEAMRMAQARGNRP